MVLTPQSLDQTRFEKFGTFIDLYTAGERYTGHAVQEGFFPDLVRLCNNGKDVCVSITRVCGTKQDITTAELHSDCCEGILPLDGDVYLYTAPPFWYPQLDQTQLFYVPKGTFVKLKPGVIHGSPISVTGQPVNVLILLPERTYSNDCQFMELKPEEQMTLSLPGNEQDVR